MNKKSKVKLFIIFLVPIIMAINSVTKRYPEFIERYYSNSIDKIIRQVLSLLTGVIPYSAAEFLYFSLIFILIVLVIVMIIKIRKKGTFKRLLNIGTYLAVLYILFMFLWGFNYNRLSFDKIAGLKVEKSSKEQLYSLCEDLISRANALRKEVHENDRGIMTIPGGYRDAFKRAYKGYEKASTVYPELAGKYGPPKPILISEKMSYTGITGMYFPYTGEANVNTNVTDFNLPNTAAHEMAHQRGFAREDEANYISYVVCSMHPDADFRYSGVMLALIYSVDAMANRDMTAYKTLVAKYSAGVKRDLVYDAEFWKKYSGKVEKVSNQVNNTYLKSNGQQDGVESYGRMVDLLLAEFKAKNKK